MTLRRISQFKAFDIINENVVGVTLETSKVILNQTPHIGISILEISKVMMQRFYYNVMKKHYNDKVTVLCTDTDSLIMNIQTDDFYKDIVDKKLECHFDFSNYPAEHQLYDKSRKAVVGLMKDEAKGDMITEFVGLRSKMYSFKVEEMKDNLKVVKEKKTCKGVKKSVLQKDIEFAHYKDILDKNTVMYNTMKTFRSYNHQIYTIESEKLSLSAFDDKRQLIDGSYETMAHGHYAINSK